MSVPVSAVAIADVLEQIHLELCTHVAFSTARTMAREVVRRGLYGELREAVDEVAVELRGEQRRSLQGRVGRLWCEVALGLSSTRRVEVWLQENGYSPEEIAEGWRESHGT